MLFPQELRVQIFIEGFLVIIADRQVGVGIHDDAVFVHLLYLLQVDDVRAVYTHEIGWEILLHLFHRQQCDDGLLLALKVYLQILAHALDVADVTHGEFHYAVVSSRKWYRRSHYQTVMREWALPLRVQQS